MSGFHLLSRLDARLRLTSQTASRIPTSDPGKRSWYIKTALFRIQDGTVRLSCPLVPTIGDRQATLATIWSCVMDLQTVRQVLDATETTAQAFTQ